MTRFSPHWILILLIPTLLLLFFLFILESTGLVREINPLIYRIIGICFILLFFWWPFDLLIHWEKKTPESYEKDRYIVMVALTVILFAFPYKLLATPFWPTLLGAVLIGLVFPGAFIFFASSMENQTKISPSKVRELGMESPKAVEFKEHYPHCKKYAMGLSEKDGVFAKLILHHREPCQDVNNAYIDYVMEIPVQRDKFFYVGGRERLQCYLFYNDDNTARVGFLPSSNFGRAYDFGFSDDEIDTAFEEAKNSEQQWKALLDKPLIVENFPGKVVEV